MSQVFDCSHSASLLPGSRAARQAIGLGQLIVLPTDTVYGVAADAFDSAAVQRLLDAKGRGRQSPPPVLIAGIDTLGALAAEVVPAVRELAERFWPGPLTVILTANPGLSWDLGETGGTVALRIPAHELALEILRETGPLAVSSANTTGDRAARSSDEAQRMLGDSVEVYLDAGEVPGDGTPSTIVDATGLNSEGGELRILREGAISRGALADALPNVTIAAQASTAPQDSAAPQDSTAPRGPVVDSADVPPAESDD